MPKITRDQVKVPVDVAADVRETYIDNYMAATHGTGRLMLFACDQKIEHMNGDFYGEGIDIADLDPEHLFQIGSQGVCGVLAGQRGLIARYAADYPEINYLVKMNSKTNLVKTAQSDPYSPQLHDLEAVLAMRENGVNVVGLGYTIYLGSEYEAAMMSEAGQLIAEAHENGLLVVLWMLVRGNIFHTLRQPAYLNPGSTGTLMDNVCYNTRGYVVDQATFVFSGNSWGLPANAVDIALLAGTTTGAPYDPLSALEASNSSATVSDQR